MPDRADVIAHVRHRIAAETTVEGLEGIALAAEVQGVLDEVNGDLSRRRTELQGVVFRRLRDVTRGRGRRKR